MIPDQIRPARRLAELIGRLHAILGTPGLMIGLFSLLSFGFGLLVVAREYDRLRRTGARRCTGSSRAGCGPRRSTTWG